MSSTVPDRRHDFSSSCWRCAHWGGLVASAHANCTRDGRLQANPVTGCAFWKAGPGDARPADWLPPGFRLRERVVIWGTREPQPAPGIQNPLDERPANASDAAKWDQQQEAKAWRMTDALMARARRP